MTRLPTVQEYAFDKAVSQEYARSALPEGPERVYDALRRARLLTQEGLEVPAIVQRCIAEAWRRHKAEQTENALQALESGGPVGGGGNPLLAAVHRSIDKKRMETLVRRERRWWRRRFQSGQ